MKYFNKILEFFNDVVSNKESIYTTTDDYTRDDLEKDLLEAINELQLLSQSLSNPSEKLTEIQDTITLVKDNYKESDCEAVFRWLDILYSLIYQNMSAEDKQDIDTLEHFSDENGEFNIDNNGNNANTLSEVHQTSGQREHLKIKRKNDFFFKKKIAMRIKKNKKLCRGSRERWSAREKKCVFLDLAKSQAMSIQARLRRKKM